MALNRFFHYGIIFNLLTSMMLPSGFKRLSRAVKPVVSCVALTTKLRTLQPQLKNDQNHNIQATLYKNGVEFCAEFHKSQQQQREWNTECFNNAIECLESLPLLKDLDPKLYELFDQVRQRKGIREQIPVFYDKNCNVGKALCGTGEAAAYYGWRYLYCDSQWVKLPYVVVTFLGQKEKYPWAHMIACHEYEHHKQAFGYYGSYHGSNSYQKEQAADAAAAGEVNCYMCLHFWKVVLNICDSRAYMGYFIDYDIQPYYESAKANGELCNQHSKLSRLRRSFMFPETNTLMPQERQSYSGFLNM